MCSFFDCERPVVVKGLCRAHYNQMRVNKKLTSLRPIEKRSSDTCKFSGCNNLFFAKGWCNPHYIQWWRGGDLKPLRVKREREGHITTQGYRIIVRHKHPNAKVNGHMFEHTYIMSQHLGRPLLPHENVHHINGIRDDNSIENLELWCKPQPAGQRVEDLVTWVIRNYPNEIKEALDI